jgi:hypothetical protein
VSTNFFIRLTNFSFFSVEQYTLFFLDSLSLVVLGLFLLAVNFLLFLNYKNLYNSFKSVNIFLVSLLLLFLSL